MVDQMFYTFCFVSDFSHLLIYSFYQDALTVVIWIRSVKNLYCEFVVLFWLFMLCKMATIPRKHGCISGESICFVTVVFPQVSLLSMGGQLYLYILKKDLWFGIFLV